MSDAATPSWTDALASLVAGAPDALRRLASGELRIGGFTNVRLDHPVLDLRGTGADDAARALTFFLAAAVVHGARVARVHVDRGEQGPTLAGLARQRFKPALERVDDESVALLRYFDVYLKPAAEIGDAAGRRLVRVTAEALGASPPTS